MALSFLVSALSGSLSPPVKSILLAPRAQGPLTWSFYCVGYEDPLGQSCRLFGGERQWWWAGGGIDLPDGVRSAGFNRGILKPALSWSPNEPKISIFGTHQYSTLRKRHWMFGIGVQ